MKSSREQFEGWFDEYTSSAPGRCKILRSGIGYRNIACQEQWESWQASRAAIEIELPDITSAEYESKHIEGGFRAEAFWLKIRKNILHMGLKVKS